MQTKFRKIDDARRALTRLELEGMVNRGESFDLLHLQNEATKAVEAIGAFVTACEAEAMEAAQCARLVA